VKRHRLRNRHHLVIDAILLTLSCVLAYSLRFEGLGWISLYGRYAALYLATTLPVRLIIYFSFGLYRRLWQHASVAELERVLVAGLTGGTVSVALGLILLPGLGLIPSRIPLSVVGLDVLLSCAAIAAPRFMVRVVGWRSNRRRGGHGRRVLIVGAGQAGLMTAREMFSNPELGLTPIGFVDDDRTKHGHVLLEIPVLGGLRDIPKLLQQYEISEVVIAMPTATGTVVREVVRMAMDAGVETRTVPGLYEILSGKVGVTALRQVEIQDLLRRASVEIDLGAVGSLATDRVVMITGAGGSIGSELCRQLARLKPREIVLLGHGENSIFEIREELRARFPKLMLRSVIADVRDRRRVESTFEEYEPYAVFHAAAHKHVPLMEANVIEAVTNNVLGTRNVIAAASAVGTPNFVLVSTDKAVRPTSVMGATKRIAEQIVQLAAVEYARRYVAVRFGNVLGSRGSVIPTFLRQIQNGGPVTITHPDMCRYFMTIPEAVQLVLQAGAIGQRGDVFVLDMGEPVKIVDLAGDLIRLSGLQVGADIEIRFTGCRPGEKLFEEMFFGAEQVTPTSHPKVLRARNADLPHGVREGIEALALAAESDAPEAELRRLMGRVVPDFTGNGESIVYGEHEPIALPESLARTTVAGASR